MELNITLFEEVLVITNEASNKIHEIEYNKIKNCIIESAKAGLPKTYIRGSISETVKDSLIKQGFKITYEIMFENNRFRYAIKW